MQTTLQEIEAWYQSQCNGEWEHSYGVNIGTIDNPGWSLCIDLTDTVLEYVDFPEYRENYEDDEHWMICQKTDKKFVANGGPFMLERMLAKFLEWVASVVPG